MPETRVRDLRADYFHPADRGAVQDFIRWQAKVLRNRPVGTYLIAPGPVTLGGVIVERGAADVEVLVYDWGQLTGMTDDALLVAVGVTGSAKTIDGFVNCPIAAQRGIVVSVDQADATITVLYL
jgi:hypothetical protein